MVKVKDISEIYYCSREKHMEKKVYVEINKKLIPLIWVSHIGDIIVLHTEE